VGEPLALALLLATLGVAVWVALGMHRGLLLSSDIKSRVWPWAPTLQAEMLQAQALSDPVWQFVPWLQLARRELLAGRLPLWNPHQDGGVPLLGNGQSALLSPLVWPALLAGVEHGWNLSLLLRVLVLAAGAWTWLRALGRSRGATVAGVLMVSLAGPVIAWLEHPHTLAVAGAPWLLAGIERGRRDGRGAWLLVAAGSWLVLVGGHPETALMVAALAGARLLVVGPGPRGVAAACGAGLTGALLAAPVLLPLAEYLVLSEARQGAGRHGFVLPWTALPGLLWPGAGAPEGVESALCVSVVGAGLAAAGAFLTWRAAAGRFWLLVALGVVAVAFASPASRWLAETTPVYWTRAVLVLPLALAPLAAAALDAVAARLGGRERARPLLLAGVVAAVGGQLLAGARGVHAVTPPEWVAATTPLVQGLAADPGVFRVLPLHTFLPANAATALGLDDLRGYDALAPAGWRRERGAIGTFGASPTVTDLVEPWDLAAGGHALDYWNVKYLLLHPQFPQGPWWFARERGLELREVYSGPDGRVLENLRVLPRARLASGAPVRIVAAGPTRWELAARPAGDDLLTVANPYFPGWRATVDGRAVNLAMRPGEAIALPLAAGAHRVVLRYRPASFSLGVALAAAGALAAAVVLLPRGWRAPWSRQRRWYQK